MNPAPISPDTVRDLRIKKRIQLVHVAKSQLGLDDGAYRLILSQWNVTSSKQMTLRQLEDLLLYFKSIGFRGKPGHAAVAAHSALRAPHSALKKYPSTMQGLRDEIADLARARWGETWEHSLNTLCRKFGVDHHRFIDISHGKAIKAAIIRMQSAPKL